MCSIKWWHCLELSLTTPVPPQLSQPVNYDSLGFSRNSCYLLEPPTLGHTDGKRPDGLTIVPLARAPRLETTVPCGISCAWTCSQSATSTALFSVPELLPATPRRRSDWNIRRIQQRTYEFVPVSLETLALGGDSAVDFLRDPGRRTASVTAQRRSFTFLTQHLSAAVRAGIAVCGSLDDI